MSVERDGGVFIFTADNEAATRLEIPEKQMPDGTKVWIRGSVGHLFLPDGIRLHGEWSYEPVWRMS